MAGRVLVRNRAPVNSPRESVGDGNELLDGDQTLDILLGFAMVRLSAPGLRTIEYRQDLQQERSQQLLWRNLRSRLGVQLVEPWLQFP